MPDDAMVSDNILTEKHHAVLFALLARQVASLFGEEAGQAAIRQAVRRYGEQRGRRMALRAMRDRQPLTLSTYLLYGEWRSATGEGRSSRETNGQNLISRVQVCPWNNAWLESGLQPFGRLYCLEVDAALARGFDPDARLDVNRTLSNDDEACEFVFHQAALLGERTSAEGTAMPWGYHCAHLLDACRMILVEVFGQAGNQAVRNGLDEFSTRYGTVALDEIRRYAEVDFNSI